MSTPEFAPRTAGYQADPAEVHRVLLLYSGGLDTSVMLRWIQERYDAEVVTLTVNLGQPGEDYDGDRGQGAPASARSSATSSTRARSSRPSTSRRRSRPTRSMAAATRSSRRSGDH